MESGRTRWTDDRIDDLGVALRADSRGLREELRELRTEMRTGFCEVRSEIRDVRAGVRQRYGESAINRRWFLTIWVTTVLGSASVIVQTSLR